VALVSCSSRGHFIFERFLKKLNFSLRLNRKIFVHAGDYVSFFDGIFSKYADFAIKEGLCTFGIQFAHS
jgi:hypothetical protein